MNRLRTTMLVALAAMLPAAAMAQTADRSSTDRSGTKQSSQSSTTERREAPPAGIANPSAGGPSFAPSDKCTNFSPCTNVSGEILRIEESYWVRDVNGREVHLKINQETSMKELPKVGDRVIAQVDSTGDVTAIQKVEKLPEPQRIQPPTSKHEDIR